MGIKEYEQTLTNPLKEATLLLLLRDDEVLLALKKRGFGVGKWNGVGGKPNLGEDIVSAAIRESQEEIGVNPLNPKKVALFNYYFPHDNFGMQVWVFTATEWSGEPTESEEMNPKWFKFSEIPYSEMWSDDVLWMPKALEGLLLKGSFVFTSDGEVEDYYMDEVALVEQ